MADYIPLQQQAYDNIRNMIADGRLEPGRCYSEKKIAADMGISRTPVRDAILRLGQDRYIDIIPSKGFCLHAMTQEDIWNTFQARTAVEGFCAVYLHQHKGDTPAGSGLQNTDAADSSLSGSAAIHGMAQSVSDMEAAIRAMKQSVSDMEAAIRAGESYDVILSHDFYFHRILVHSCGNHDLENMMDSYHHRLSAIAFRSFEQPGRPQEALEEHREILGYLTSDSSDAETALYRSVMKHMEASRDIALRLTAQ